MRPQKGKATGSDDMFRARLDQIIDMRHALVLLAQRIDWDRIDDDIAEAFVATKGQQAVPTRFMIGLMLLKQISGLSDEAVREHWVINIYYQYVTEEDFFQHKIPHPTNAKLFYKALVQPNALAHREGVTLCQSYLRVGKKAQIMAARYAHAHQIEKQRREDHDWKLYSWHAPETKCIGKGKAHKPYECSCKVSITMTNARSPGGQFVIDAQGRHGDKANVILSATGYNFRLILKWLRRLFTRILAQILSRLSPEILTVSVS